MEQKFFLKDFSNNKQKFIKFFLMIYNIMKFSEVILNSFLFTVYLFRIFF